MFSCLVLNQIITWFIFFSDFHYLFKIGMALFHICHH